MSNTTSRIEAPRADGAAASASLSAPRPDRPRSCLGARIYYLHPLADRATGDWNDRFARCAALGFTDIVLAPPFAPGRTGDIFQTLDHQRLHPSLGGGDATRTLADAASLAAGHGLRLMLDLVVDRVAAGSALAGPADDLPDPRLPAWQHGAAHPSLDADALGPWHRLIAGWLDAGLQGFRCAATDRVPATVWRQLIATARTQRPDALFIAADPAPGLAGCGFDLATCASWAWDGRADWLADDIARAAAVAPVLAMAEPPFGRRAGSAVAAHRALAVATAIGAAWMMPMGFENGARTPLDRRRAADGADETAPLADAVREANRRHAGLADLPTARLRSAPGAAIALFARGPQVTVAVNTRLDRAAALADDAATLAPGEVKVIDTPLTKPVPGIAPSVDLAVKAPRIAIEAIAPMVDGGRFAAKRRLGDWVDVEVDLISDGHEMLAGMLLWRPADETAWHETPLRLLNNDRWTARFKADRLGRYLFTVEAWRDEFATFQADLAKKQAAGRDLTQEIAEGVALVARLLPALASPSASGDDALAMLLDPATGAAVVKARHRPFQVHFEPAVPVDIEREAASFSSWYELFPRSQSGDEHRHGTFDDVIARLPAVRDMGFDVLYFPPIHPIGRTNRKGRNNVLVAAPDDPGSPYAIGGAEGGHDAIHPDLGTLQDFLRLRDAAAEHGLELALDFAIQCSPDHPWLREHRGWFAWRPDGSIKYAENPPKRYEDIVNVDFYAAGAIPSLWIGLRDVVAFWIRQGIRIFRVDNPHTKPLPFWEWMIGDIRAAHPDVIFLAEAFTRPKMMYRLAKVGFAQSYTYFTWRDSAFEMREYLTELTTTAPRDFFRPNFFVNTPDINPVFLQRSGRAGFLIRAALAATLSGLWGVYSGFELCEAAALPGREEYADSEKYQIRAWDWQRPGNIVDTVTRLNAIRRANPALQSHLGIAFLPSSDPDVLVFVKSAPGNTVVVAISFDPFGPRETDIVLPAALWAGAGEAPTIDSHTGAVSVADNSAAAMGDIALTGTDLMGGHDFAWRSGTSHIGLNPAAPFLIWRLRPSDGD